MSGKTEQKTTPEQLVRKALARARRHNRRTGRAIREMPADNRNGSRDPLLLGTTVESLAADMGWKPDLVAGGLIGRWREIVGAEVADHCEVVELTAGVLTLQASSSAWATNLRLMTSALIRRCEEEIGPGVVVEVDIRGPRGPSFRKGRLRVAGRGPRDTWG